jgi:hypothetical protein
MDVLKDFLISTFFEAALAFLWICPLVVASSKTDFETFLESPGKAIWTALKRWATWVHDKKAPVPLAIMFVLFSYPLGVVMQRVSDDFIETTSLWMPKPLEWPARPYASFSHVLAFEYKAIGRDQDIKKDVFVKYCHLLGEDMREVKYADAKNGKEETKKQKIIRDTRTRRAFGRENSSAYLNRLLELVRICQASSMHLFLLCYVLTCLSGLLIVKAVQNPVIKSAVALLCVVAVVSWNLSVPYFHDEAEFNVAAFLIFLFVNYWLVVIGCRMEETKPIRVAPGWPAARQTLVAAFLVFILCYFATFSWKEHRENYEEAVLILGGNARELPNKEA